MGVWMVELIYNNLVKTPKKCEKSNNNNNNNKNNNNKNKNNK